MPTKKERLDAIEADMRTLREDLDGTARGVEIAAELTSKLTGGVERLTNTLVKMQTVIGDQTARHDQAMEIVGTRIGELAARLDKIEHRLSGPFWQDESPELTPERADLARSYAAPFPTGAATTVDDALAAVPPADDSPPRRGDRVRLEGARDHMGRRITDGWYEVVGHDDIPSFQITTRESTSRDELGAWMPWLRPSGSLKEIRRAPTPRSPIEPEDGLDV